MANQDIQQKPAKFNDDYDDAAEKLRLHLKDETWRLAIDEIVKLTPKAVRYLQGIQEFDWIEDDEGAVLCANRFVEIARLIASNCKVLRARERVK